MLIRCSIGGQFNKYTINLLLLRSQAVHPIQHYFGANVSQL